MESVYSKDESGKEYYPRDPKNPNQEIYLFDHHRRPIFAKDEHGNDYYATDSRGHQYVAIPHRFARSFSGSEIYPKYENGGEYPLNTFNINVNVYAVDARGKEMYPKSSSGNEYLVRDPIREKVETNFARYARDEQGNEYYPKDHKNKEYVYAFLNYAKKANGDEFYPKKWLV